MQPHRRLGELPGIDFLAGHERLEHLNRAAGLLEGLPDRGGRGDLRRLDLAPGELSQAAPRGAGPAAAHENPETGAHGPVGVEDHGDGDLDHDPTQPLIKPFLIGT